MPLLFAGAVAYQSAKRYQIQSFLKKILASPEVNSQTMRSQQVAGPVNETVKEGDHKEMQRKIEDSSSGSEHGSECTSFTDMVCGLMDFDEEICSRCNCSNEDGESCSENEPEDAHSTQILESVVSSMTATELHLLACVKDAMVNQESMEVNSSMRRSVMMHLKTMGYNAAICKSRWESIRDFPSGEYEYMDVIMEKRKGKFTEKRFLVDIDFRAQFEMARPTKEYSAMVELLPNIFVGNAEKINQIIKIMCDAAKRSLKKKTMHIPPWRKYRYMRSKWLGSYRRTTNPVPAASNSSLPPSSRTFNPAGAMEIKCLEISFHPLVLGEWKPPSVNPESKNPAMNAGGKISGLASALIQAGLTNSFSKVQPTH